MYTPTLTTSHSDCEPSTLITFVLNFDTEPVATISSVIRDITLSSSEIVGNSVDSPIFLVKLSRKTSRALPNSAAVKEDSKVTLESVLILVI